MNKELHPRSDVARIYVPRKKEGRGLISCESCVRREENSLSWHVRNSEEALLRKVGESNVVDISEAVDPKEYKMNEAKETENEWKQKRMHGQLWEKRKVLTGIELGSGLQKEIWKDILRPRYVASRNKLWEQFIRDFILITQQNPLCAECAEVEAETVASECGKLVQTEYKERHDNVARCIHCHLCGKCGLERANSWYEQKPEGVVESENFNILWDFTVQCDRKI